MKITLGELRMLFEKSIRSWDREHLMGPEEFDPFSSRRNKMFSTTDAWMISQALEASGALAIPSGKAHSSVLGRGAYGIVLDVVHEGKHRAMKVTQDEDDYGAYVEIHQMYDRLPGFVKRHLPRIYVTDKVEGDDTTAFYTIMEKLAPLPTGIALQGWGYDNTGSATNTVRQEVTRRVLTALPRIIDRAIRGISPSATAAALLMNHLVGSDHYAEMLQAIKDIGDHPTKKDDDIYPNEIAKSIITKVIYGLNVGLSQAIYKLKQSNSDSKINDAFEALMGIPGDEPFNPIFKEIYDEIESITGPIYREYMPEDHDDLSDGISNPKETLKDKRLIALNSALKWLSKNKMAYQGDMHPGNVMYRPSTDDLVVVDVGMWWF